MLVENTLFGELDRVQTAISRLKLFNDMAVKNHPNGFLVLDSGGKDSDVIKQLALLSGIRFEIVHCHTTADHPVTVQYVRQEQCRWQAMGIPYTIQYPMYKGKRTSMWELIALKGAPNKIMRWCCHILKEQSAGAGRYTVTGVRWAESIKRARTRAAYELPSGGRERIKLNNDNDARRCLLEHCMQKGQTVVNPIIDWQDSDVWDFHAQYGLNHNPLYEQGYHRVGCVGCPMGHHREELEEIPQYKTLYIHAFQRFLDRRPDVIQKYGWKNGEELYEWWVNGKALDRPDPDQLSWDDMDGI